MDFAKTVYVFEPAECEYDEEFSLVAVDDPNEIPEGVEDVGVYKLEKQMEVKHQAVLVDRKLLKKKKNRRR